MTSNQKTHIILNDRPDDVIDDIVNIRELLADLMTSTNPSEVMGTELGVKSAGKLLSLLQNLENQSRKQPKK